MRLWTVCILVAVALGTIAVPALAGYSISTTLDDLGYGYRYTYYVYNINEGWGYGSGLDGFFVLAPEQANVIAYAPPPSAYGWPGFWYINEASTGYFGWPVAPAGSKWIYFWGAGGESVYPAGSTAVMSFTTDKTTLPGLTTGDTVGYFGGSYGLEQYSVLGPTAQVPEAPAGLLCALAGVMGACLRRLKRR